VSSTGATAFLRSEVPPLLLVPAELLSLLLLVEDEDDELEDVVLPDKDAASYPLQYASL